MSVNLREREFLAQPVALPLVRVQVDRFGASKDLRAIAKDGGHQPRIPAPVKNRDDPKRLLVWCVRNEVLVARDVESQRSGGQIWASMSDLW